MPHLSAKACAFSCDRDPIAYGRNPSSPFNVSAAFAAIHPAPTIPTLKSLFPISSVLCKYKNFNEFRKMSVRSPVYQGAHFIEEDIPGDNSVVGMIGVPVGLAVVHNVVAFRHQGI